jgi:hypothetical protein
MFTVTMILVILREQRIQQKQRIQHVPTIQAPVIPTIPPVITSIPDRDINEVKLNVNIQDKRIGTIEKADEPIPKRTNWTLIISIILSLLFIIGVFKAWTCYRKNLWEKVTVINPETKQICHIYYTQPYKKYPSNLDYKPNTSDFFIRQRTVEEKNCEIVL